MDNQENPTLSREETVMGPLEAREAMAESQTTPQQMLSNVVQNVRETALGLSETAAARLGEATGTVSVQLEQASVYMQENLEALPERTRETVRQHPGASLLAGAALGFLIGCLIWR